MNRVASLALSALCALPVQAADLTISTAGAAYAPLDVKKGKDISSGPLSAADRRELMSEFKGMVAMGLRSDAYARWSGRSMSDCLEKQTARDPWSYRCEIITGQGNGFYYFYSGDSEKGPTLQHLDIRIQAADPTLVEDMKRSIRSLFGHEQTIEARMAGVRAAGPVRRWRTHEDAADLFVDVSEDPRGMVRFVWKRGRAVRTDS